MFLQSFNSQEQNTLHYETGDRFIPQRCQTNQNNFRFSKILLSHTQEDEDILKQDISKFYLHDYSKCLESALNIRNTHARLLMFSSSSPPPKKPIKQVYQWPVRCRRRPLIKQPHHLLDLPNFRSNFFLNLLDWGPSNYLAAALHKSVYLYSAGEDPIELTNILDGYCTAVKWDFNGDKLTIGTCRSAIEVWNTEDKKRVQKTFCTCVVTNIRGCTINALTWHISSKIFVSGCSNGTLMLIPLASFLQQLEQSSILHAHEGQISSLRCSPDGHFLASCGEDSAVRLWLWPLLTPVMEIMSHEDPIRAIAWHPWHSSYLAIGGSISGSIIVWNVNKFTQEANQKLHPSSASVCSLEWSPVTGELVAAIWVPAEEEPMGRSVLVVLKTLNKVVDRLECYAGRVHYLLWSPDGKQIATVGSDETLRIWYFLGPSSAREKNIWRFLKPMVPSSFITTTYNERKIQNNRSHMLDIKRRSMCPFMSEELFEIHENNFGCVIR